MGCDYWVAANGSDTAAGTEAAPFATFQKGYDALCPPTVGASGKVACPRPARTATICFKSGTYNFSASMWIKSTRSGTSSHQLKFMAAPNATTRPIMDFSGEPRLAAGAKPSSADRGIKINADYVLVKGFEVRRANDNGIHIQGANDVVENCVAHDNDDTGIQIGTDVIGSSGIEQHHQELRLVPQLRRGQRRRERRRLRHEGIGRYRQPVHRLPLVGERRRRLRLLRLDQPGHADGLLGAAQREEQLVLGLELATATASSWAATAWAATTS